MSYELKQEDVYGFISFVGAVTKEHGNELQFKYCPYCYGGGHKDEYTFSLNKETGLFNCARGKCGRRGHFIQLARDFNFKLDIYNERKYVEFPQPERRIIPRESAYAYLASRGIGKETAEKYQVTSFEDRKNILWFPFFDENKKLVYAKFRRMDYKKGVSKGSKEWQQKEGKPILFGMSECEDFGTIVITEGQIDSMSCAEAGIKNACSVPCGKSNDSWVNNCKEWLKKFDTIIIFGDLENGKMSLVDMITKNFTNKIKLVRKQDYLGEKDANAILQKFGAEAIRDCINNAEPLSIECVKPLSAVMSPDLSSLERIATGIYRLDDALDGGIMLGQLCILTGKRGDGKSTLMSQIIADAIDQDYNTFIYSGELTDYHFKAWLNLQVAGEKNVVGHKNKYGKIKYVPTEEVQKRIDRWYDGRAFIYDNTYTDEHPEEKKDLIDIIEQSIRQYNIKLVCVDNLMTAMDSVERQNDLYHAQGQFVGRLKKLTIRYNVAAILVAHPRKAGKDDDKDFDVDDIAGSSDIANKADIIINYAKPKKEESYQGVLSLMKNRLNGYLLFGENAIHMMYNDSTKRVTGEGQLAKVYSWEKEMIPVQDIDVPF